MSRGGRHFYTRRRGTKAGDVSFTLSPDDATATSYEVRVYPQGGGTLVASYNIGKPPHVGRQVVINMKAFFNLITAGNYEVKVAVLAPGDSAESTVSNAFSIPIP